MKQKLLDKILYVFSVEPYEITEDADKADVIKVQQETYEGFVNQNPDIASKIVKYNYHMFTVNKQEWAPYVDEPDPEPEPTTYHVYLTPTSDASQDNLTVMIDDVTVDEWSFDESAEAYVFDVSEGSVFKMIPSDDPINYSLTSPGDAVQWVEDHWEISPTEDIHISIDYVIPATECTVTLTGTGASDTYINVEVGGSLITDFTDYTDQETGNVLFTVNPDSEIKIYPLDNQENYSVTCADADVNTDDSDQYYWYVVIPNDTTIEVDYTDANPQ